VGSGQKWSCYTLLLLVTSEYSWLLSSPCFFTFLHFFIVGLIFLCHSRLTWWVWHMLCVLLLYPHGASQCLQQFLTVACLFVAGIQAVLWHCLVMGVPWYFCCPYLLVLVDFVQLVTVASCKFSLYPNSGATIENDRNSLLYTFR
jgi:hypothetical protein